MIKKILKNHRGLTFIELIVVIFIISIITSVFAFNVRPDNDKKLRSATERLAADIRYVRNLATSRAVYDFEDGNGPVYPANGYGMFFYPKRFTHAAYYFIYADKGPTVGYDEDEGDEEIKRVYLEDRDWQFNDFYAPVYSDSTFFYFNFLTENKILEVLRTGDNGNYAVAIINPKGGYPNYSYFGIINIAEELSDGTVIANIGAPTYIDQRFKKDDEEEEGEIPSENPPPGGMGI